MVSPLFPGICSFDIFCKALKHSPIVSFSSHICLFFLDNCFVFAMPLFRFLLLYFHTNLDKRTLIITFGTVFNLFSLVYIFLIQFFSIVTWFSIFKKNLLFFSPSSYHVINKNNLTINKNV